MGSTPLVLLLVLNTYAFSESIAGTLSRQKLAGIDSVIVTFNCSLFASDKVVRLSHSIWIAFKRL